MYNTIPTAPVLGPVQIDTPRSESQATSQSTSNRIHGYDVARAIAVFGMILVNYHSIFLHNQKLPEWFATLADLLYGRAATLFVMLAGVGLVLMSRRALKSYDPAALQQIRHRLFRRSVVLFIMGLIFMQWWKADILHFYGIYLTIGALLLAAPNRRLWGLVLVLFIASALFFCFMDGDPSVGGWFMAPNRVTEVFDDLFLNGHYPVFPWLIFLLIGMWFGRFVLMADTKIKRQVFLAALGILVATELLARDLPPLVFAGTTGSVGDGPLGLFLMADVFPITPLFSISAAASAILVIITSLTISRYRFFAGIVDALQSTGKLTLTIYITHIFIGLGLQKFFTIQAGSATKPVLIIYFTFGYCLLSVLTANIWFRHFTRGPLEWLLRRLSGSL
jgi:uncharacterized protein